ncbi:MAG TPA: serine/threonine-protein kinase [Bryobacteraceae bacterium]|nr:serine/threonine-protein kinase [Bryobacteraceae bacterium]
MKRCTICHATYPAAFTHCPHDGSVLTEANEWAEGSLIRGKYRILGKLGQGGMATVYKALHVGFDETCALKVINQELASDLSFVKRFAQEAALTRKLHHSNAVRVEDVDQADDGRPFMVMEFIEGESLKDVIQRQAPLPVARVCSIAKQVAGALEAAHQLGMIHRDIKPGNILLTPPSRGGEPEEVAKVLDFGIAKIKEVHLAGGATLTRTGTSIGTPAYMSPEQAMGKTGEGLDGRADLYSLGVVMYEMLTGELPIQAESEVQMLIGQISSAPEPIRARRPDLPEGIGAVVMRCLEKDPARRPASAAALIALIEATERGVPAGAAPDEMPTVATRRAVPVETPSAVPARQRPRWVWVALLVALVVSARGVWHFGSRRKSVTNAPSVGVPSLTNSPPSPEAAPRMPPPPQTTEPQEVPSKPEKAERPEVPEAVEPGSNPADDIQGALNAVPFDAATKKEVKDILRQATELMKKGDFDGAAAQYRRLAQLHPGWGPAVAALTALAAQRASAGVAAQNRDRTGELAGTVAHYRMAASLHPNVASNHYKLGCALGKIGDLDGDMREQEQALRLEPSMAAPHAELGSALARKETWDDAAREYREAIQLKPSLAEAHSGLGDALGHVGDWQGEIAEERIAIRRAPGLAIAHFRLGLALERQGETAEALQEYRRAAELQPGEAEFQANYQRLSHESKAQ